MNESVRASILAYSKQMLQGFDSADSITLPFDPKFILNIVSTGMGGSALSARIVESVFKDKIHVPFEIVTDYENPFYIGQQSLVLVNSYSGNTEETISSLKHALLKQAKVITISKDGLLSDLSQKYGLAYVNIDEAHNPSNLPRLGTGYGLGALLSILSKMKMLEFTRDELLSSTEKYDFYTNEFLDSHLDVNESFRVSQSVAGFFPIIISARHLLGASHYFKNSLNETSKNFAVAYDLPELNHHLLEGFSHPDIQNAAKVIFLESDLYPERIKERINITKEVLEKNSIKHISYKAHAPTLLSQALEIVSLASVVASRVAENNHEDATKTPWVDYFKSKLS